MSKYLIFKLIILKVKLQNAPRINCLVNIGHFLPFCIDISQIAKISYLHMEIL